MKKRATKKERETFRTMDEFEIRYLPKRHELRLMQEVGEGSTLFAQRLAESFLKNMKDALSR